MTPKVLKTSSVLEHTGDGRFSNYEPRGENLHCKVLRLTHREWDDLGQPRTITITIEPGNTLEGKR